jgi:hypothetical protein
MTDLLEGVRDPGQDNDRNHARALARRGRVAYSIVETAPESKPSASTRSDNRGAGRQRTRLRSGKILDAANCFLSDCLIHDRSATGLRLALPRNLGLPQQFRLHDDETGAVDVVATVWRRGAVVGVRYSAAAKPEPIKPSFRFALRGRYYAVPD